MPIVYRCKNCGYVFFVYLRVGQDSYGVRTPTEFFSLYASRCPRCGRRLEKPTADDIVVEPEGDTMLEKLIAEEPSARKAVEKARQQLSISRRRFRDYGRKGAVQQL